MKKILTLTLATLTAATVLTACASTDATTPGTPTVVTVTATPAPTGTLREQFQANDLMVLGLDNATLQEAGESMCEAREAGAPHRMVAKIAEDSLEDFYTPGEVETALGIWYVNLCPSYAA